MLVVLDAVTEVRPADVTSWRNEPGTILCAMALGIAYNRRSHLLELYWLSYYNKLIHGPVTLSALRNGEGGICSLKGSLLVKILKFNIHV